MRKLAAVAAALLMSVLTLTVSASQTNLRMTDVQANPGETVRITVSLNEETVGNAVGIAYTYDETRLEALPEQCGWVKKGVLQDFGSRNQDGVWAVSDPVDLKGDVCILVFRALEEDSFVQTEVSCTLTVKNGDREVGTWQAEATVSKQCSHSFGYWSDAGELGHSRSCGICQERQTQGHAWDEGTVSGSVKTITCTLCAATKTEEVMLQQPSSEPTTPRPEENPTRPTEELPKPTYPTEPTETTEPTVPRPTESSKTETTKPTQGSDLHGSDTQSGYEPGDYNRPAEETIAPDVPDGHTHTQQNGQANEANRETVPMVIPIEGWTGDPEPEAETAHDHDHDAPVADSAAPSALSAFTALATVVILAAAGWLYLKKK